MLSKEVIDKIYFVCRQYFGDNEKAEDIAHDTFVGILRWPPSENLETVAMSFLKTLVFRYARQQDGRNTKHLNHVKSLTNDPDGNFDIMTTETPLTRLLNLLIVSAIQDALKTLPETMRNRVIDRYWNDVLPNGHRGTSVTVWQGGVLIRKYLERRKLDFWESFDTMTIRYVEE